MSGRDGGGGMAKDELSVLHDGRDEPSEGMEGPEDLLPDPGSKNDPFSFSLKEGFPVRPSKDPVIFRISRHFVKDIADGSGDRNELFHAGLFLFCRDDEHRTASDISDL